MKILVCLSTVPDTTTKIALSADLKSVNSAGVQFIINPYDEHALSKALELKEAAGGSVTVIAVAGPEAEANIRKALAIGADDAIRINAAPSDAYYIAYQIAQHAREIQYDLILAGRESIDYNGSQLAGMLAELLGIPAVSICSKLSIEGGLAVMERETDGGKESLEVSLPLVLSAQKDLAEARIPNMRGIMSARTKPLKVIEPASADALTRAVSYALPAPKAGCKYVSPDNAGELLELLHNEAKII